MYENSTRLTVLLECFDTIGLYKAIKGLFVFKNASLSVSHFHLSKLPITIYRIAPTLCSPYSMNPGTLLCAGVMFAIQSLQYASMASQVKGQFS